MTEQQRIFGVLQSMIGSGKLSKTIESLYPEEFKNPYVDDGSFEFEKLRAVVIKNIAKQLYGDETIQAMKAVPDSTIKKVMKELKDSYQEDIEFKKQRAELAMEAADVRQQELDKLKVKTAYDKYKNVDSEDLHKKLIAYKNPQFAQYTKDFDPAKDATLKKVLDAMKKESKEALQLQQFGAGARKNKVTAEERKRRSDRMKEMHRSGKLKK